MMKKKQPFAYFIPLLTALLFSLLSLVPFYKVAEYRLYDLLLHFKPAVPEDEAILLVDIDDLAIARVGVFPWSRDIMADGLILMSEFEAGSVLFDIEYTEQSPRGVNADLLAGEIPDLFTAEFARINENISDLFAALAGGDISLSEARDFIRDLTMLTDISRDTLLERVADIARDNDDYFGRAARLYGKAYYTVNMLTEKDLSVPEELKDYTLQNIARLSRAAAPSYALTAEDIRPAILPILSGAAGAGFPNVEIDAGGVLRRIKLLVAYREALFAQLAFSPLLDWLGNPEIEVRDKSILLEGCRFPGGEVRDLRVPLAEDQTMLINWPKKKFGESFRHLTYWELVRNRRLELNLLHNMKIMEEAGYLSYYRGQSDLLAPYRYAEEIKGEVLAGADPALMADYREARAFFFDEANSFLSGDVEAEILGQLDALLELDEIGDEEKTLYSEIRASVPGVFAETREIAGNMIQSRSVLADALPGSFCVIGWTGTSTTDIGVNPFHKEYENVGTHAAVANTILQGRFLDDAPWYVSSVLALLLAFLVVVIIRRLSPLASILAGIGCLLLVAAAGTGFFLVTGIYPGLLTPLLSVFFAFLAVTVISFLKTSQEKTFIRNAFSHYLSTDVVSELIKDPDKLRLGGEEKVLTALFTDVKGFSTVSEELKDPTALVNLINAYLTEMSNVILELKGTIDKYEGDAIMSFFGAPLVLEDHARRACLAAVRMKKMERHINEHFLSTKLSPVPLLTRVGINTGEMVVGNMGTTSKMDYTIMGNSVNLASRLEGVNKQYGTWILVSEPTWKAGGADFLTRKLDRVRVVGIKEPVRLFELIDEKSQAGKDITEAVGIFHRGLELFEAKQWAKAQKLFEEVLGLFPEDGPAQVFAKRCATYRRKPPAQSWDGVFNLTVK
jgi:adenylate cyclase